MLLTLKRHEYYFFQSSKVALVHQALPVTTIGLNSKPCSMKKKITATIIATTGIVVTANSGVPDMMTSMTTKKHEPSRQNETAHFIL